MTVDRRNLQVLFVIISSWWLLTFPLAAQVPQLLSYHGRLTQTNGVSLTGEHMVTFRIYDVESGGAEIWKEPHQVILTVDDNGLFSAMLGTNKPLDALDFNRPLWLSIEIDNQGEMTPRQRLASVGYAINADTLDGIDSTQFARLDVASTMTKQLTLTSASAALVIKPATPPVANTKLLDLQSSAGASRFSVDADGNVTVAGNLAVSGSISGASLAGGTVTSVDGGAGLTGGPITTSGTLNVGAGTGITVNADDVAIKLNSAGPGLVADASGLSLLRTCTDGQLLKWTAATSSWGCAADLNTNAGGTITGVTAGTGLSGGGTSGTVTVSLATPVAATSGGTGLTSYAVGDLLYASAANTLSALAKGTDGQVLKLTNGLPAWGSVSTGSGTVTSITAGTGLSGGTITATGTIALATPVSIANGGTGASTASTARTNLGAAASGANADITSLAGLTTALSLAQGGTGATTAAAARTTLSAAASGANGDITSLTGLTTPLSVAQGGTGATTLTDGGLVLGKGTSALTTTGVLAKGTLVVGDGATDPALLSVGSNNALLVADSTQSAGVRWAQGCMPIGSATDTGTDSTFYMGVFSGDSTNDQLDRIWPIPLAGTITSFRAYVNQAPGGSKSWTVTFRKNASNTSLACTISGSNQSCSGSGSVTVAAGDRLGVTFTTGGKPSDTSGSGWSACFIPN